MILYKADSEVAEWVAEKLFGTKDYFGQCHAIGHVRDNKLIAGVVYNNYKETPEGRPLSIEMSIASIDKRWATRAYLRSIFSYPFIQLDLERVQIITSTANEGINSVVSRLGFQKEGTHRKGHFDGSDCYSWGMLREDCEWHHG